MDVDCKLDENLASVSFEELQNLKDRLGSKVYSEAIFGARDQKRANKNFKRANKNRPREESSKRPVQAGRNAFELKKEERRDPRFDDKSGLFNETVFRQTYDFLKDIKEKERTVLKKELDDRNVEETRKSDIKQLLRRMTDRDRTEKLKDEKLAKRREAKKEIIKQLNEGKKPFFMKKSDERKLELAERFQTLKTSGKLEKYMQKKRRKNAAKERKHLPN